MTARFDSLFYQLLILDETRLNLQFQCKYIGKQPFLKVKKIYHGEIYVNFNGRIVEKQLN